MYLNINRMMTERQEKKAAECQWPTEREWCSAQPHYWRRACQVFAIASNTRGGVVDKSMRVMVEEAKRAGVRISLATFQRHTAHLQAWGLVFQDDFSPRYDELLETYNQRPSTWIIRLNTVMPDHVRLTDIPSPRIPSPGIPVERVPLRESDMATIPF